jgi:hypothetical protein
MYKVCITGSAGIGKTYTTIDLFNSANYQIYYIYFGSRNPEVAIGSENFNKIIYSRFDTSNRNVVLELGQRLDEIYQIRNKNTSVKQVLILDEFNYLASSLLLDFSRVNKPDLKIGEMYKGGFDPYMNLKNSLMDIFNRISMLIKLNMPIVFLMNEKEAYKMMLSDRGKLERVFDKFRVDIDGQFVKTFEQQMDILVYAEKNKSAYRKYPPILIVIDKSDLIQLKVGSVGLNRLVEEQIEIAEKDGNQERFITIPYDANFYKAIISNK